MKITLHLLLKVIVVVVQRFYNALNTLSYHDGQLSYHTFPGHSPKPLTGTRCFYTFVK